MVNKESKRSICKGETVRNDEVRWNQHNNRTEKSNPLKHIKDNLDPISSWSVLSNAPKSMRNLS